MYSNIYHAGIKKHGASALLISFALLSHLYIERQQIDIKIFIALLRYKWIERYESCA